MGTEKTGEKQSMKSRDHLFQPGQSGNVSGRPKGRRNRATLAAEALLDGEAETITRKCIDLAKGGDSMALKLCLSRILPVKRERSIELDLPALGGSKDSLKAIARVVAAVADGEIAPAEGQSLASLLETHRRHYEIEELERRLEDLEAQQCAAR